MKILVENLNQIYDNKKILENLNFSVNSGEFISIIGPSGCGKSTIFKIITGLEQNYSGIVKINNTEVRDFTGKIAYMPQNDLLLPWRNLYDNVKLPLEIEKMDKNIIFDKIMKLLPDFRLGGEEKKFPNELSGGMQKRTALLRTFLINSDIILLDEPFGALDAITRSEMQNFLLEVWGKYKHTILFITHDIEEAIYLSDKIIILEKNPAKILDELKIELPRPRNMDVLLDYKFLEYKKIILHKLAAVKY